MATYYSTQTGVAYRLRLEVTESNVSIAGNSSTLNWKLFLDKTNTNGYWIDSGSAIDVFTVYIDGISRYSKNIAIKLKAGVNTQQIASGSVSIKHNTDGSRSVPVSFKLDLKGSYYGISNLSGSGTFSSQKIPTATIPTITLGVDRDHPVEMGTGLTISTSNRKSTSFKHKVRLHFGDRHVQFNDLFDTQTTVTVPTSFANVITTETVGVGVIVCETYDGDTYIGSQNLKFWARIPDSAKPLISDYRVSPIEDDVYKYFGALIQGYGMIESTYTTSLAFESKIVSEVVSVGSASYPSKRFIQSKPITQSGTIDVTCTVTDERGRQNTKTKQINVIPYTAPKIISAVLKRANDKFEVDEDGTKAIIELNYECAELKKYGSSVENSIRVQVEVADNPDFTGAQKITTSLSDVNYGGVVALDGDFPITETRYVRVFVDDYFTQKEDVISASRTMTVVPAFTLINFGAGGHSIAFGSQSSDKGYFECNLPFMMNSVQKGLFKIKSVSNSWVKLGTFNANGSGSVVSLSLYSGNGETGNPNENTTIKIYSKLGSGATGSFGTSYFVEGQYNNGIQVKATRTSTGVIEILVFLPWSSSQGFYSVEADGIWTHDGTISATDPSTGTSQTVTNYTPDNRGFPIDSVYVTYTNTNPSTFLGGTWIQFSQGRVLVGVGNGSDGSNSLTFAEKSNGGVYSMALRAAIGAVNSDINSLGYAASDAIPNTKYNNNLGIAASGNKGTVTKVNHSTLVRQSNGDPATTVQPWQSVYYWRRTA